MKLAHILAAGLLFAGVGVSTEASARHHDGWSQRHHDGRWDRGRHWNRGHHNGWRNHRRCWTEWRHHHRVRRCR